MDRITLIYTYYNYPERMALRMKMCRAYSDFVKKHVDIIIVDDASKIPAHKLNVEYPENVSVYRIKKDILWNEKGARNLGSIMAKTDWIVYLDFDHWFENDDLLKLVKMAKQDRHAYRFQRFHEDGEAHHKLVHNESFLIQRHLALQAGCFSESFTGLYGGQPYKIFYERYKECGGIFCVLDTVKLYIKSNGCLNAPRDGDKTEQKMFNENHGMLHFQWERVI